MNADIEKLLSSYNFSDKEILDIVSQELPDWKRGCDDHDADAIMFHPDAFGYTAKEMLLMAVAIKYAVSKQKQITIAPKKN